MWFAYDDCGVDWLLVVGSFVIRVCRLFVLLFGDVGGCYVNSVVYSFYWCGLELLFALLVTDLVTSLFVGGYCIIWWLL